MSCVGFLIVSLVTIASAQTPDSPSLAGHVAPKSAVKGYAIEFRARNANSYGHTFSLHGRLDAHGKFIRPVVSGLHPATESPIPWMIGHVVAVPSETGASDGDTEDQYVLARFRVLLSEGEHKRVLAFIKALNDKSPVWHAVTYNCNAYIGEIARFMGLSAPHSTMAMPKDYIDKLRDLNIARTDLVVGTPVKVPDAEALRAQALKSLEQRSRRAGSKSSGTQTAGTSTSPTP